MELINNTQSNILENLGRFKFLTTSQIQRLCGKSIGYIREQLSSLQQRKYIASYNLEKAGRAEYIYYLVEKGKNILLENNKVFDQDIKIPVGVPLVVRDYNHRKNFVDLQIALYQYFSENEIEIEIFNAYYDKTGNNRTDSNLQSKTRLDLGNNSFFMPDGICITDYSGSKEIYLLEMYNGKDTLRTISQIAKHSKAIATGAAGKKYNIQKNPLVICAFEFESAKQAVMKRLEQNERFKPVSEFFYFGTLHELQKDFKNSFENLKKEKLKIT